jgi:hypothetical protein
MRNFLPAALLLVALGVAFNSSRVGAAIQGPMVGGYKSVAADNPEVTAAARFAVAARGKSVNADISLNSVLSAARQTVAGVNYRLCLEVEVEGATQNVRAVVFKSLQKQYQLKSWEAADCGGGQ